MGKKKVTTIIFFIQFMICITFISSCKSNDFSGKYKLISGDCAYKEILLKKENNDLYYFQWDNFEPVIKVKYKYDNKSKKLIYMDTGDLPDELLYIYIVDEFVIQDDGSLMQIRKNTDNRIWDKIE